jgi:hypothetical protein
MKKVFLFLLIIFVLVLTSCVIKESNKNQSYSRPTIETITNTNVVESAKIGCRTPDEPGCQECIQVEKIKDGRRLCFKLSKDKNNYSQLASTQVTSIPCESDLPPCAKCTKEVEELLLSVILMEEFKGCDCSKDYGMGTCYYPTSCGCLCERYLDYLAACPFEK